MHHPPFTVKETAVTITRSRYRVVRLGFPELQIARVPCASILTVSIVRSRPSNTFLLHWQFDIILTSDISISITKKTPVATSTNAATAFAHLQPLYLVSHLPLTPPSLVIVFRSTRIPALSYYYTDHPALFEPRPWPPWLTNWPATTHRQTLCTAELYSGLSSHCPG